MVSFPQEFPFVRRSSAHAEPPSPAPEPTIEPAQAPAPEPPAPVIDLTPPPPAFSSPKVVAQLIERRKIKRDALAAPALLRVDGVQGPPAKVELIDISVAGVRFRAPRRLDIGDKAQIRLEVGPFRWTTRLRVVHCSPADEGPAVIGCTFLRTELLRPWPVAA